MWLTQAVEAISKLVLANPLTDLTFMDTGATPSDMSYCPSMQPKDKALKEAVISLGDRWLYLVY